MRVFGMRHGKRPVSNAARAGEQNLNVYISGIRRLSFAICGWGVLCGGVYGVGSGSETNKVWVGRNECGK